MKPTSDPGSGVNTPDNRAKLFDEIVEKIISRDAFVPVKLERLGVDVRKAIMRYRDEMIAADTDERLLYTILKISCARKDPHVRVSLVKDGLKLEGVDVGDVPQRIDRLPLRQAPIRFAVDYSRPGDYFLFVADYAKDIHFPAGGEPEIGDRLTAVNGMPFGDYFECVEPYNRYATINGLWWRLAAKVSQRTAEYPPHLFGEQVTYTLERRDGREYTLTLPYCRSADEIAWLGTWKEHGDFRYPGFELLFKTSTYQLYRHCGRDIVLLDWNHFDADLMPNMDRLVEYASEHGLLDCAVIVDATRAGGGSLGAYAIQRLTPKPFKTTFGNLRISDVVEPFIEMMKENKAAGRPMTAVDGGGWLLDWLETDVRRAIREGRPYSNNVPFKSSHLPKDSDGVLQPAELHFRGPLVCLLSPHGGSHLDQFAAMIVDNNLAHVIGMPAGGYSNTWEWTETLYFPGSRRPVVALMYSMGHTIRPNGELLEGNPAEVHDYAPLCRDNFLDYHTMLLSRALDYLNRHLHDQ